MEAQLATENRPGTGGDLGSSGYFSPGARRRVVVILTDGESVQDELASLPARLDAERIKPFLVRIWGADERIYFPDGTLNGAYNPDPASENEMLALANSLQTPLYTAGDAAKVTEDLREALGKGPHGTRGRELQSTPLAPIFVGLAFLPLLYLLYRRNLPAVA